MARGTSDARRCARIYESHADRFAARARQIDDDVEVLRGLLRTIMGVGEEARPTKTIGALERVVDTVKTVAVEYRSHEKMHRRWARIARSEADGGSA